MRSLLQLGYEARRQHLVLVKSGATFSLWSGRHGDFTMRRATLAQVPAFLDPPQRKHLKREKLQTPTSQILSPHQAAIDARQREQRQHEEEAWRSIKRQEVVHTHIERVRFNGVEQKAPKPIKPKIERVVMKRHSLASSDRAGGSRL